MTPAQQAAVVAEAESWLGTPYHHQGDIKGAGVDCAMILVNVYHAIGLIPAIDPRPYPHDWHLHRDAERYLDWVHQYAEKTDSPQPGDIAMFQFGRCVAHGAIVTDWPNIIHAHLFSRKVVRADVCTNADLMKRLRGFYRLK